MDTAEGLKASLDGLRANYFDAVATSADCASAVDRLAIEYETAVSTLQAAEEDRVAVLHDMEIALNKLSRLNALSCSTK